MFIFLVGLPLFFKKKIQFKTLILGLSLSLGSMLIISNLLMELFFYSPLFNYDSFTIIGLSIGALFIGCIIAFLLVLRYILKFEMALQRKSFIVFIALFITIVLFTFNFIENVFMFS